ncbi:PRC and DUF2382 domain-containing protein [Deinococcus navajonensis]|uniref:PRC and DUF2382 domain-containing protein n=1 Tax=Deinococcus navajonensis TaxID=309884 RepID=A0ABV8XJ50_9DEIO
MARLFPISRSAQDLSGHDSPIGLNAYGMGGKEMGTIREALADETGRIRYLVVDASRWFVAKDIMVPVGLTRITDDGVYFDELTHDHARELSAYVPGHDHTFESQVADERVLRAVDTPREHTGTAFNYRDEDQTDTLFKTTGRLRLLEERLVVNKDRFVAGSVEISKHVETSTQRVAVALHREEVVIERLVVTEDRPVNGEVQLGGAGAVLRVELKAERANVGKQAFIAEEVAIGKRVITETETITAEVGREVLDVHETGEVRRGTGSALKETAGEHHVMPQAGKAVKEAVDPLDGEIDRR